MQTGPQWVPPPPRNTRRRVWWIAFAVLLAAVVGGATWGAVAEINSTNSARGTDSVTDGSPTKVFTGKDGRSQITVPSNWDTMKAFQNAQASIQVGDPARGEYAAVFTDAKDTFPNLGAFDTAVKNHIQDALTDATIDDRREFTIGSLHAVQYVVEGKVAGVQLIYWWNVIDGQRGWHQLMAWSAPSQRSEVEHTLQDVIQTFRELT
jgi:curli biogenesis system outer membrane secretion channel CsgG